MLSENLLHMQEWFVAACNSDGFHPGAAERFADLLKAQSEKAKRLEASVLAQTIPLTTEHLEDPKITLFPVVGRNLKIQCENEG